VGCGGTFDKKDLLRIVRAPLPKEEDGVAEDIPVQEEKATPAAERVFIDFTGKKSGRGAYICKNESCLAKARKNGRLRGALECEITDALYEELHKEILLG